MSRTRFSVLRGTLLVVVAVLLTSESSLTYAADLYHVGDSVTAIQDTEIKAQNSVVGTLAAGATATIKKIDGVLILVDSDVSGWVPAERVVAFDKAVPYFTKLVDSAPNDPHNYYFRAGVWQTQGKYDLAIQDYDAAIRLDPKQAAYYNERGGCYMGKKDYPRALVDFNESLRLQPNSVNPYIGRGGVYCEIGEYEKAIADWKLAARMEPEVIMPRACLVELLACCPEPRFRRGELAVKFATSLCEKTDWQDSQTLHYLACAYAEAGDFTSAVKWEKEAIAHNSADHQGYLKNFQKAQALFESHQPLHEFVSFIR